MCPLPCLKGTLDGAPFSAGFSGYRELRLGSSDSRDGKAEISTAAARASYIGVSSGSNPVTMGRIPYPSADRRKGSGLGVHSTSLTPRWAAKIANHVRDPNPIRTLLDVCVNE